MEIIYIKISICFCFLVLKKVINWMISIFCYVKYCRIIYLKIFIIVEKLKKYYFKMLVLKMLDVLINYLWCILILLCLIKRVMFRKIILLEEIYSCLN